jgi:tRNA-splicing ligase RtcB (3'-phosphate/5'-hydroxy nucleic acid ligase)
VRPFALPRGRDYLAAMCCAANMSFANRQVILHRIREVFSDVFGRTPEQLGIRRSTTWPTTPRSSRSTGRDAAERTLLVHRKGATRAFPPGHPELPPEYRETGQPVIIGGSMETGSYLMLVRGSELRSDGGARHPTSARPPMRPRRGGRRFAYKSVDAVVAATAAAGLSAPVARFRPIGNVKG